MENRPNIDRLLESIKQSNKALLRNTDLGISQLQGIDKLKDKYRYLDDIDMLPIDSARLEIFMRHYDLGKVLPPLDTLFDVLVSAQRMAPVLEECAPEARMGMKLYTLLLVFWVRIMANYDGDGEEARYRQAFYDKIDELPKDNLFRKVFVEAYNHDNAYGVEIERRLLEEVISETEKAMKSWELALMKPRSYLKENGDMTKKITTSEGITTFIETINAVYSVLKDPEAPKETQSCLLWWCSTRIWQIVHYNESRISEELFNRRNEIDKENILRNYVVAYCVTKKAMNSYEEAVSNGDKS